MYYWNSLSRALPLLALFIVLSIIPHNARADLICEGDSNGDRTVDVLDLFSTFDNWNNTCDFSAPGDPSETYPLSGECSAYTPDSALTYTLSPPHEVPHFQWCSDNLLGLSCNDSHSTDFVFLNSNSDGLEIWVNVALNWSSNYASWSHTIAVDLRQAGRVIVRGRTSSFGHDSVGALVQGMHGLESPDDFFPNDMISCALSFHNVPGT